MQKEDKMPYKILSSSQTPALIIYLLDISASMGTLLGNKRRIDVLSEIFAATVKQMAYRSTKGSRVLPRYNLALFTYSDDVYDVFNGVKSITEVINIGLPEFSPQRTTDTSRAFSAVKKLLQDELPKMDDYPAPLVCHITDGKYTGSDPEPIVRRIMQMGNSDGNVLVENIFISSQVLNEDIRDIYSWQGITRATQLGSDYAQKLRSMSSNLPESHRIIMRENGYGLHAGAVMMIPGDKIDFVNMGFVMSVSTPLAT